MLRRALSGGLLARFRNVGHYSRRMTIVANARGWWVVAALGPAIALAGCLGPEAEAPRGQVEDSVVGPTYRYEAAVQAAGAGAIPVEVRGSAAGLTDAALADAVVDAMPSRSIGLATRFAPAAGPPPERVVWIFGTENRGRLDASCGDTAPAADAGAAPRRLAVTAAWCQGTVTVSGVRAIATDIPTVADPAFGALIATLTTKLFPMVPPSDRMREALTPRPSTVIAVE
jgi:hypothetical protein